MASRATVISTVTLALKDDFPTDNVVNRFKTVNDLINEPGNLNKFPWLNVTLASHGGDLSLDGSQEDIVIIPIAIFAFTVAKVKDVDLQIDVAALIDSIVDSLTSVVHTAAYCAAGFGITSYNATPAEDEQHHEVGVAFVVAEFVTGD